MSLDQDKYILITPVYNEEAYIQQCIESIKAQKLQPFKWVIVSDASTDNTDIIVKEHLDSYPVIEFYRIPEKSASGMVSRVNAINFAYQKIKNLQFNYVGILDADITLDPNYYSQLIKKFEENNKLGIAGGVRTDLINGQFYPVFHVEDHVCGGIQFFRKKCYEQINGYLPIQCASDGCADISARMCGWEVKTDPNLKVIHHREMRSSNKHWYIADFIRGRSRYLLGYHPVYFLLSCIYRSIKEKPYFLASLVRLFGFFFNNPFSSKRPVSKEFVEYIRNEQRRKVLKSFRISIVNSKVQ